MLDVPRPSRAVPAGRRAFLVLPLPTQLPDPPHPLVADAVHESVTAAIHELPTHDFFYLKPLWKKTAGGLRPVITADLSAEANAQAEALRRECTGLRGMRVRWQVARARAQARARERAALAAHLRHVEEMQRMLSFDPVIVAPPGGWQPRLNRKQPVACRLVVHYD